FKKSVLSCLTPPLERLPWHPALSSIPLPMMKTRTFGRALRLRPMRVDQLSAVFSLLALVAIGSSLTAQSQRTAPGSDSAVVADFEHRFSIVLDTLRQYSVVEKYGPNIAKAAYREKWVKRWCLVGDFTSDVR